MSTKTYFINSPDATYNDNEFAWFQTLMLTEGIIGDSVGAIGFLVEENGTPDMSVLAGIGNALVEVTISGRTFKVVIENDTQEQLVIAANSSGSNRIDAIIIRVDKDATPNALKTNMATIEVVLGTGVSALTDGDIDTAVGNDGWYRLADVTVSNGASTIVNADIADTRSIVYFSNGSGFSPLFINKAGASPTQSDDENKLVKLEANGHISEHFLETAVGGTGEDGDLNVTTGTTTIDLSTKEVWNYKSITVASGATLTFTNGTAGDKIPILKCKGDFDNQGTITTKGLGVAGGTGGIASTDGVDGTPTVYPFADTSVPEGGNKGGGGTSDPAGSAGLGGLGALKVAAYFAARLMNGSAGAGGGGGAPSNVGSAGVGGDGGDGSLGLRIEVGGNFSNTGIIELDGVDGVDGGTGLGNGSNSWSSGGGGGGGGGAAGSLIVRYRGTFTNTGTITANGGAKGIKGSTSSTGGSGGSPVYGAGGGGGSGGASHFADTLDAQDGQAPTARPSGGDGSDGADGIIDISAVN